MSPQTRIVALLMDGGDHYRRRMLDARALACVIKSDASAELVAAIEAVLRGETYLSPSLCSRSSPPRDGSVKSGLGTMGLIFDFPTQGKSS